MSPDEVRYKKLKVNNSNCHLIFIQNLLASSEGCSDLLVLGFNRGNQVRSVNAHVLGDAVSSLSRALRNSGQGESLIGASRLSAGILRSKDDLALAILRDQSQTGYLLTRETGEFVVVDVGDVPSLSGQSHWAAPLLQESVVITNALPDQSRHRSSYRKLVEMLIFVKEANRTKVRC